jgi:hypothetical protein
MFEPFHTFKVTIIIGVHIVTSPCILISKRKMYLALSAFTSSPVSLQATTKASTCSFYSIMYTSAQYIIISIK